MLFWEPTSQVSGSALKIFENHQPSLGIHMYLAKPNTFSWLAR
jgi:hypothetical protein